MSEKIRALAAGFGNIGRSGATSHDVLPVFDIVGHCGRSI